MLLDIDKEIKEIEELLINATDSVEIENFKIIIEMLKDVSKDLKGEVKEEKEIKEEKETKEVNLTIEDKKKKYSKIANLTRNYYPCLDSKRGYGYLDTNFDEVIPCEHQNISKIVLPNDEFMVKDNNYWRIIDIKRNTLTEEFKDYIIKIPYVYACNKEGKWGCFTVPNKTLFLPFIYDSHEDILKAFDKKIIDLKEKSIEDKKDGNSR